MNVKHTSYPKSVRFPPQDAHFLFPCIHIEVIIAQDQIFLLIQDLHALGIGVRTDGDPLAVCLCLQMGILIFG